MKKFDYETVTGHDLICAKLKQAVAQHRFVSAYVFSGAEGIGKKTVANPFAAALLCHSPKDGKPCLSCPSCKLMQAGNHPDFIVTETPADKKSIGVEQVRDELIKEAYVRPFSSSRKVFLIKNGETMTAEAQNALLKILEEPPEYVVFIILTTAQNLLLETVLSRCLKLQFLPLNQRLCHDYFQEMTNADSARKELAASFAQGNIGRGKRMLTDEDFYNLYEQTIAKMQNVLHSLSALTEFQQFLTDNREKIEDIIDFMLVFLRDALRLTITGKAKLICTDRQAAVSAFSQKLAPGGLIRLMEAVIHYRERLQKNASFTGAGLELLTKIQEEIHDQSNRNPI